MPLPEYVMPYWDAIQEKALHYKHDPVIIAAIGDRETRWGTHPACKPQGPACLGDMGHGHGLMQIDDRSFPDFCSDPFVWGNPDINIAKGCLVLRMKRLFLEAKGVPEDLLLRASIAAYNCGEGNVLKAYRKGYDLDHFTAGGDYSKDVLQRAARFRL